MASETAETAPPKRPSEEERVIAWRLERFWELGFTISQSENLSDCGCDWHEAKRLIDAGCLPKWVYRFLLP